MKQNSDFNVSGVVTQTGVATTPGGLVRNDDARLSNARVPVGHAASHGSGAADAITPGAIGAATGASVTALSTQVVTHLGDTSNPHGVTATQVGLGYVTNDAQLKVSANLGDLNNLVTARANLGLGSAALMSVGVANGVCGLGGDGKVASVYLPTLGTAAALNVDVASGVCGLDNSAKVANAKLYLGSPGGPVALNVDGKVATTWLYTNVNGGVIAADGSGKVETTLLYTNVNGGVIAADSAGKVAMDRLHTGAAGELLVLDFQGCVPTSKLYVNPAGAGSLVGLDETGKIPTGYIPSLPYVGKWRTSFHYAGDVALGNPVTVTHSAPNMFIAVSVVSSPSSYTPGSNPIGSVVPSQYYTVDIENASTLTVKFVQNLPSFLGHMSAGDWLTVVVIG